MHNPNNHNLSVHHTAVEQVSGEEGEGWEFHCSDCGFQLRYFPPAKAQAARLVMIRQGDVYARHISEIVGKMGTPDKHAEDRWLTADIRQTIKEIVRKLDTR